MENANRLQKELETKYENVSIKESGGSKTLFRVRLGRFSSREEAMEFGEENLKPDDLQFRVVDD